MIYLLKKVWKPSPYNRFVFFCVADMILFVSSLLISFLIHFELSMNVNYFDLMIEVALFFIVVKIQMETAPP